MKFLLDLFSLTLLRLKFIFFQYCNYFKIVQKYYIHFKFFKIDSYLLLLYFFQNPFKISKKFLMSRNESEIYTYGETPLTALQMIMEKCQLTADDVIFELGCGRARTCFWLNCFTSCRVIGVDFVPEFIHKAKQVKERFQLQNLEFRLEDFLKTDLDAGTVFYLYGICLSDPHIIKLVKRFKKLPAGVKFITMSYSLNEYHAQGNFFKILEVLELKFPWGIGTVYIQEKI